jgi:hypothetical protein
MGIGVMRAALMVAAALAFGSAVPASSGQSRAYGREVVAQFRLPAEAVARYAALSTSAKQSNALHARATSIDSSAWVGPLQQVGSGRNPYTLVVTIDGVVPAAGAVRSKWRAGWEVRESPTATREVQMAVHAVAPAATVAGAPITLTAVGTPVSFRGERHAAPMLNLIDADNLDISDVSVQVWSGSPPLAWPGSALPRAGLLALGALCLLAWWGLRRQPRPATRSGNDFVITPSQIPSSLPAPETLPPRPLQDALERKPTIVPQPPPAPPAQTPSSRVVAALQQVLSGGLEVQTQLDPVRGRRRPRGASTTEAA